MNQRCHFEFTVERCDIKELITLLEEIKEREGNLLVNSAHIGFVESDTYIDVNTFQDINRQDICCLHCYQPIDKLADEDWRQCINCGDKQKVTQKNAKTTRFRFINR